MSAASVQRQVALAGVALLAAVVALALTAHDKGQAITGIPQPVPVAGGSWYTALAGAERPRYGRLTRCGYVLKPGTEGLTDSVLPCGILVYVAYKDSPQILTRVIDRRPVLPGRKFAVSAGYGNFEGANAFGIGATALLYDGKQFAIVGNVGGAFGLERGVGGGRGAVSVQW